MNPGEMPLQWLRQDIMTSCDAPLPPIHERMFFELCSKKRIEVTCSGFVFLIEKRGEKYKIHWSGNSPTVKFCFVPVQEIIEMLKQARPILKVVR